MPAPDSLPDTQAILLDDGVSDAQLADILMRVHAEELTWLSTILLSTGESPLPNPRQIAQQVVTEALAQVVTHRDRLWEHLSLRAWLAYLVLQNCKQRERDERLRQRIRGIFAPWRSIPRLFRRSASHEKQESALSPLQLVWGKMPRNEQVCLLLQEVLRLSQAEIASVLEIEAYPVYYWLRESRRKIYAFLANHPHPGLSVDHHPETGEGALADWVRQLWPRVELTAREIEHISTGIAERIQISRSRRRKAIATREVILVSLVLAIVFFACRTAGLLPEEIIHRYRTPTPLARYARPAFYPTPDAPFYYYYYVAAGDSLQTMSARAGVKPEDIIGLNWNTRILKEESLLKPGSRIKLPARPSLDWRVTPTPVIPASHPPPLTIHSDTNAVLQRILDSHTRWRTLWITVQQAEYGPPGYLGPPLRLNIWQEWYSQPDRYAALGQFDTENPQRIAHFFLENIFFTTDLSSKEVYAYFSTDETQINPFLSLEKTLSPESRLTIRREEQVADRQALVVDVYDQSQFPVATLWVDAITGVILRQLEYSRSHTNVVLRERHITAITYDQDFPPEIFSPVTSPLLKGYARDHTGQLLPAGQELPRQPSWPENGHAPLPVRLVPRGLDLTRQPVFLQWPESWEAAPAILTHNYPTTQVPLNSAIPSPLKNTVTPEPLRGTTLPPEPRIAVFASRYYLGSLPLKNVSFHACQRSPDGALIALSVVPSQQGRLPNQLYWFKLDTPQKLHRIAEFGSYVSLYKFSPDSRRLAFWGCDDPVTCHVLVLDLLSGARIAPSIRRFFPTYLAWSPDSRFLAIAGEADTLTSQHVIEVLDADTSDEVFFAPYPPQTSDLLANSLNLDWILKIPLANEVETGCMNP